MKNRKPGTGEYVDFFFGFSFMLLPLFILFSTAYAESGSPTAGDSLEFTIPFLAIFFVIGAVFTLNGFEKLKRNLATTRRGLEGYGEVVSINPTNVFINNEPQLEASIRTYIPKLNAIIFTSEIAGVGEAPYAVGSVLAVKYWDFDINILYEVEDTYSLPVKVQEVLLGRAVADKVEKESAWDNIDTENWTLTQEAFPDDIGITRQEDSDMAYSEDQPLTYLRKPQKTNQDKINEMLIKVLKAFISYVIIVIIVMMIRH